MTSLKMLFPVAGAVSDLLAIIRRLSLRRSGICGYRRHKFQHYVRESPDATPALPASCVTIQTVLYWLRNGDVLEVLHQFPDCCVTAIVTDSPYGASEYATD